MSDLKIIDGQVYPDFIPNNALLNTDIVNAKPDYLIIGSGKFGLMKVSDKLRRHLSDCGIEVIVEPSKAAMKTYNKMYTDGKSVTSAFHLTY